MDYNILINDDICNKKCTVTLKALDDSKFIESMIGHGSSILSFIDRNITRDIYVRSNSYTSSAEWSKVIRYKFTGSYYRLYTE